MCDLLVQDCPPGEKCMPYGADGYGWDSLKCAPVMRNPGQAGELCTVEGNAFTGIDSCDLGHMCWNVDADTGVGTCVRFCSGSPGAPSCDAGAVCKSFSNDLLLLCLPECDPLAQNCPVNDVCVPDPADKNTFICALDASGEEGQEFDPCEYANVCDPGFCCLDPELAVECDPLAPGCCIAFCDITADTCVGANAECSPWYGMSEAPPGLENVGVCAIP